MIAVVLATGAGAQEEAPLGSSAGVTVGVTAARLAARHALVPTVHGWVDLGLPRGWLLGGELGLRNRRVSTSFYTHQTMGMTASVLAGWGVQRPWFSGHVAAGVGGALEVGSIDGYSFVEPGLGVRLRSAYELRFGGPVVLRLSFGALARDVYRWDFDTLLGLGATW